jgi:class 3 adenylate cyclase
MDMTARRLAAILAADVVGYSRMMGEDEAGTAKSVRESREAAAPIIAAHGGRIFKTMGDGFLVEFASVVSAVECALALQAEAARLNEGAAEGKRLRYRMGIHLGDVLVEGDDLVGDGVNIAARLEQTATPGKVCISRAAYENVQGRLEARLIDLGEMALKNIARPVHVYAVGSGPGGADDEPPPTAPTRSAPPRLSLVVLFFANLGGGPEQEYFVDGITESLTTIEAETGAHVWADRFDKPVAELFGMQDGIVARIANELSAQIIRVEARRAEKAASGLSRCPRLLDHAFPGGCDEQRPSQTARGKISDGLECQHSHPYSAALQIFAQPIVAVTWDNGISHGGEPGPARLPVSRARLDQQGRQSGIARQGARMF